MLVVRLCWNSALLQQVSKTRRWFYKWSRSPPCLKNILRLSMVVLFEQWHNWVCSETCSTLTCDVLSQVDQGRGEFLTPLVMRISIFNPTVPGCCLSFSRTHVSWAENVADVNNLLRTLDEAGHRKRGAFRCKKSIAPVICCRGTIRPFVID